MSTAPSVESMLKDAHKTLDNANNFTHNATGGKPNAFAPKPALKEAGASTDYSHARAARKDSVGGEVESAAEGLKAKQANVDEYAKSPQ